MSSWTREQVAATVDHTLLKPEATALQVAALVAEGRELGVAAVCVSPSQLPVLDAGPLAVATVCGFPSGAHLAAVKAFEAARAVELGADEVDMVISLAAVVERRWDDVRAEIAAVRAAVPAPALVKVIIESAALSEDQILRACAASEEAGADFVKTSTGFHPAGGASAHAVRLMAGAVGGRLGVKASGGIRTAEAAVALLDAGATRLGLSGTAAVLDGVA